MTTREEWATGALEYAGWNVDKEKVIGLVAHQAVADVGAPNNPLSLTEDAPDAADYSADGTKAYPSLAAGYGAWYAATLNTPQAASLADESGGSALGYARAVGDTRVAVVAERVKNGDPDGHLSALVVTEPAAPVAADGEGTGEQTPPPDPSVPFAGPPMEEPG